MPSDSRWLRSGALVLFSTLLFLCVPARGTVMVELDLEEMVAMSDDSIIGTVTQVGSYWNDERNRIYTDVAVRVEERLFGTAEKGSTVSLKFLGGTVDGVTAFLAGTPTFRKGERVLLFTYRRDNGDVTCLGLSQGKFEILLDAKRKRELVRRDPALVQSAMVRKTGERDWIPPSMDLDAFVERIRAHAARLKTD